MHFRQSSSRRPKIRLLAFWGGHLHWTKIQHTSCRNITTLRQTFSNTSCQKIILNITACYNKPAMVEKTKGNIRASLYGNYFCGANVGCWLAGWLPGWLTAGWLACWLACWLAGLPAGWLGTMTCGALVTPTTQATHGQGGNTINSNTLVTPSSKAHRSTT